jgi:glycosyltransferase involved in cell wall biosynthesis
VNTPVEKISGCVITFNEQAKIAGCLRSLAACCDELLVVDSGSVDATRELAEAAGARVLRREWTGYRSQKQFAVDAATHDWILFLDADEEASEQLAQDIQRLRDAGAAQAAYRIPFRSIYLGRKLRFGDTARESHVRFFDRRRCRFGGYEIHERIEYDGAPGRLAGHILHDSYRNLEHQLSKAATYARLMGEQMHAHGKRGSLRKLLFNPPCRFLRGYLFRLGFLDGWRGLVWSIVDANYVRQKYLHLWVLSTAAKAARKHDASA